MPECSYPSEQELCKRSMHTLQCGRRSYQRRNIVHGKSKHSSAWRLARFAGALLLGVLSL
jgi:hypothetical protein